MPAAVLAPLLQDKASPAVCTNKPLIKLAWTTSKKPPESFRLRDSLPVTAAPQVLPPLAESKMVWPFNKLPVGNCCVLLLTPTASGLTLLKKYSQYLVRSEMVAPVLFCNITNSFPVILISARLKPDGTAANSALAAKTL